MGHYDPDTPYVIGNQYAPLVREVINLDTGSEVGFVFTSTSAVNPYCYFLRVFSTEPPAGLGQYQALVAHVYDNAEPERRWTPAKKLIVPCTSGTLGTGASFVSCASVQDAMRNPSDASYVRLTDANAYVRMWFGTTDPVVHAELSNWDNEIIDVTVKYLISSTSWASQPGSMTFGLERPATGNWIMDDQVTGPDLTYHVSKIYTSRLGELNPWFETGGGPWSYNYQMPWAYESGDGMGLVSLAAAGGDNINLRMSTTATAAGWWDIHYAALEITYRESCGLKGVGGLQMWSGCEVAEGLWAYDIPILGYPDYDGSIVGFDPPGRYTITVGKGHAGMKSVTPPNPIPLVLLNSLGRDLPDLSGRRVVKTTTVGGVPTVEYTSRLPAMVWYDCDYLDESSITAAKVSADGHAYIEPAPNPVASFVSFNPVQIINNSTGTYKYATFYAKRTEATDGALIVYQMDPIAYGYLGPSGEITVAEFDALPEIVDGWKRVTVEISPPAALVAGSTSWWGFDGGNDEQRLWQVLGCSANPTSFANTTSGCRTTYGNSTAYQIFPNDDYNSDLTLFLSVELDAVADLAVAQQTQALTVVDTYCNVANRGIPTGIVYNHITWTEITSAVLAGWKHYELQRRDTTMPADTWETIATVPSPATTEFDDYEARIGVQSSYRIRMVHRLDLYGPWSAAVTSTIAAPGVTGTNVSTGLLCLTSNYDPTSNLAYVHVSDDAASEEFTFVEAAGNALTPVYNRDYQVALRPAERGGVTFTRNVLVNAAGIPTATLDAGFTGLRDLAWAALPYVCVRDERAHRWLSNINVPTGRVKRLPDHLNELYIAELVVTEVSDTPAPYSPEAPYRGLNAGDTNAAGQYSYIQASTPTPTALRTAEVLDMRIQVIPTDHDFYVYAGRLSYLGANTASWWDLDVEAVGMDFLILDPGWFNPGPFDGQPHDLVRNQKYWLRITYERNYDNAGTGRARYYKSPDNSTWTLIATETDNPCAPLYGNSGPIVETFEAGSLPTEWAASNASIAQSAAQAHAGTKSALLTTTGTPSSAMGYATHIVQGADSDAYVLDLWTRATGTHANVTAVIHWYDHLDAYISSSVGALTLRNVATDAFGRTVANGWGSADTGGSWTTSGGAAGDYSVSSGTGKIAANSRNVDRATSLDVGSEDFDVTISVTAPSTPTGTGATYDWNFRARYVDSNNFVEGRLTFTTSNTVTCKTRQYVGGVETASGSVTVAGVNCTTAMKTRIQCIGTTIKMRTWAAAGAEPGTWDVTQNALTWQRQGTMRIHWILSASTTNTLPVTVQIDNMTFQGSASAQDTWENHTVTGSAPVNATTARFGAVIGNYPPTSEAIYIDDVSITGVNEVDYQGIIRTGVNPGITLVQAEWRVGIDGAVVASPDFVAAGEDATSYTDAQGNVWSIDYS